MIHFNSLPLGAPFFSPARSGMPTDNIIFEHSGEHRPGLKTYPVTTLGFMGDNEVVVFPLWEGQELYGHEFNPGDWISVDSGSGYYAYISRRQQDGMILFDHQEGFPVPITSITKLIGKPFEPVILGDTDVGGVLSSDTSGTFYRWKIDGITVGTSSTLLITAPMDGKEIILFVDGVNSKPITVGVFTIGFLIDESPLGWRDEFSNNYVQLN